MARSALPTLGRMVMDMAKINFDPAIEQRVETAMEKLY